MSDPFDELMVVLRDRQANPQPGSYSNRLLSDEDEIAKKIGEEAIEIILAAANQSNERLLEEMADLVYHLSVLLVSRNLGWADVEDVLSGRAGN